MHSLSKGRGHGWSSVVKEEKLFLLSFDPLFLSPPPRIQIQTVASARRSAATGVKPIKGEVSWWESGGVKDGSNGIYRRDMLVRGWTVVTGALLRNYVNLAKETS